MLKDAFGHKLKKLRKEAGLTQESLSATSGIGWRFLQELEAGRKQPSIATLFKLAKALNTTPGAMLDDLYKSWQRDEVEIKQ
jgi:transcriptional regulator with XRE-family HTH domain